MPQPLNRMLPLEDKAFLLLVASVSVAFLWIVWPFYGAVLWGAAIAIVFAPLGRRLRRELGGKRSLAAALMLTLIVVIVIVPLVFIGTLVVRQSAELIEQLQAGELDYRQYLVQMADAMPAWAVGVLERFGITTLGDLEDSLADAARAATQFLAERLLLLGQNTFSFVVGLFVMVYLLFFLLRDGDVLARRVNEAMPLRLEQRRAITKKFTTVIRAMFKGTLAVALAQGGLGGLIFWVLGIPAAALWGVVMGILSLLPAIGTPLVWLPVALYLLAIGDTWQGVVLIVFGALVISLVDNVLRPILVGKDTKIPDYLVLISTLGGLSVLGANGLLIGPVIAALFLVVWDIFSEAGAANRSEASL